MMKMRWTVPVIFSAAILTSGAVAQSLSVDPGSLSPKLHIPLEQNNAADKYRRLPYRDLASEIRIELAADDLYDFDRAQIRSSAADYLQQTANLIFERAKGPVHIECRSDRGSPTAAQKLAAQCATAISQWLIVQEKLTKVKFTTVGTSVPPPVVADPGDPFAPKPVNRANVTIVFAKN
jgi:outer membrane protein OmpA-like peptidoglycan-associated protein